jgi:hypothetical protein
VIQALIMCLLGRRVIDNYGTLVEEAAKLREVNKALMDALAFYANEESYEGDPVPVMEDRGMSARVALLAAKELLGDSTVSA